MAAILPLGPHLDHSTAVASSWTTRLASLRNTATVAANIITRPHINRKHPNCRKRIADFPNALILQEETVSVNR